MRPISCRTVRLLSFSFLMVGVWSAEVLGGQLAKLDKPTGADWFGFSAATDGNFVVIGDLSFDASISKTGGTAIVYRREGSDWVWDSMLIPQTVAPELQLYGYSLAIDQDLIVVGSYYDMSVCNPVSDCSMGSANVFRREDRGWVFEAKLYPDEIPEESRYGLFVSLRNGIAVVGAIHEPDVNGELRGVLYVFRREGTSWVQEARIAPAQVFGEAFVNFDGAAHATDGERLIVGATSSSGVRSAYVFRRDGTTWSQEGHLVLPASAGDYTWGNLDVDINGDLAVLAWLKSNAFVYRLRPTGWAYEATLSNRDLVLGNVDARTAVNIDGSNILVTTIAGNTHTPPPSTFAIYAKDATSWKRVSVVNPADDIVVSIHGTPVDLRNGLVVAGARESLDTFQYKTSAGYIFEADALVGAVPAVTTWGVMVMALLLVTAATCIVRFRVSTA